MSGNEPNKHKRGEGWGDGEMGAQMGKYERNKQKKRSDKLHWNSKVGFPDSEMFLPRPALCDSVSFFFVLEKIKALNTGQGVTI